MQAIVQVNLEPNVDFLRLRDLSTNATEIIIMTTRDDVARSGNSYIFKFFANEDGSDKHLQWDFVSDGSVQFMGFNIWFKEIRRFLIENI